MAGKCNIIAVSCCVSLVLPVLAGPAGASTSGEKPFARVGPALVKGNFHRYPPFYSNVIAPHAVLAAGKVYCAFQDTRGRPVVMVYDIGTTNWSGPVTASQFGLGSDAHGNPSICLDNQGYIHVFYGCHGGRMRHTRSTRPRDISRWSEQPSPTNRATYPQTIKLADGRIFLFYRAGGHVEPWCARISADGGRTWSEAQKVIEMRLAPPDRLAAAYASICPGYHGRTVHCFWVHKDDNAARVTEQKKHPWRPLKYKGLHEAVYRYNMYYIRRDPAGTWRNIEGRKVQLPISKAFAHKYCMVYDSGDEFTNIGFPFVDNQNRPYVRFTTGVGDWKKGSKPIKPWHSLYANYDAGKWHVSKNIPVTWPAEAGAFAAAKGSAAFGPLRQAEWFIYYAHEPPSSGKGTGIYLYNLKTGYAIPRAAPAKLP